MKKSTFILSIVLTTLLSSCVTPTNYNYLQDLTDGQEIKTAVDGNIRLQPMDQVSILVKSKDPMMSALFNKGITTNMKQGQTDGNIYMTGYTVGSDGCVDFPVIGKIALAGKTRYEAEQTIQAKLREEQLKDATVTVEFMNLSFTVTGEVNVPGVYPIEKDAVTLLEALGTAGDVGVYGKRDSVMVVRQTIDGTKKAYVLNLNSAKDILSSEAFYIHQNDVIYVKANDVKVRQSTANGNETRSISFWLSIVSVLTSVAILIFK